MLQLYNYDQEAEFSPMSVVLYGTALRKLKESKELSSMTGIFFFLKEENRGI